MMKNEQNKPFSIKNEAKDNEDTRVAPWPCNFTYPVETLYFY